MKRRAARLLAALSLALFFASASAAHAQNAITPEDGAATLGATREEIEAVEHVDAGRHVRARELAEKILARDPKSFAGHLVLGMVQHYGEANLPAALFHLSRSRALFEERFGVEPGPNTPHRWHMALLKELASVQGDMEQHEVKLGLIDRYNELYEPPIIAERAWPLMKLKRFAEARLAAELGLASDRPGQRVIALNALCAIEFEAGNDGASYDACKRAVDDAGSRGGLVSAVDLTNLAEASRSIFKLDEAERIALDATSALPSWYGNPWMELGELYVRQGRFAEALAALRKVPEYRMQRPPHVRDADRGETRRVIASFLLVMGKADEAFDVTGRAIAAPDRRAHNSRDPAQDESVIALLDRAARNTSAELALEAAAVAPWYARPLGWLRALARSFEARRSAARVAKLLDDDARLSGMFRIGQASAAIVPPWLVGELVHVLGPGVAQAASERAAARDKRPGARAYYDAVSAEVLWSRGEPLEAITVAERSLQALGPGEALLSARVHAIAADAARQRGLWERARVHYDGAFQRDPGVLRRLGLPVAVRVRTEGALGEDVADMLERSPRFTSSEDGLVLSVRADAASAQVCLASGEGQMIACAEVDAAKTAARAPVASAPPAAQAAARAGSSAAEPVLPWPERAAAEALRQLFAPRIDLSQTDITSLDGQNLSGRDDALRGVLE
jgi:tetratricopeptide (TPR) repeat protein